MHAHAAYASDVMTKFLIACLRPDRVWRIARSEGAQGRQRAHQIPTWNAIQNIDKKMLESV